LAPFDGSPVGSSIWNVVPLPRTLSTHTFPKWSVTTDWTIATPLIGSFGTLDTDPDAHKVVVQA